MKRVISTSILPLAVAVGCSGEDTETPTQSAEAASGGTQSQSTAGTEPGGGGAQSQSTAGAAPGGAGGADTECPSCAALDEDACAAMENGELACERVYGEPWTEPGVTRYAGCANWCKQEGAINAETCARPADPPMTCFTLPSGLIPEGWVLVSEVQRCGDFRECGDRPEG